LIESKGVHLFLLFVPAYSPDYTTLYSRGSLLQAEELPKRKARTKESLLEAMGLALDTITVQDAEGWFGRCGFGASLLP
jgi:hypothetical protein